jgi:PPOX class probable F420-dependent enzyme
MPAKVPPVPNAIRAKVEKARVARLATLDAKGTPHLVPVCFVYDREEDVFYSAVDHKPKRVVPEKLARLRNIRRAPNVALLIDKYGEDWTRLWYILVRGRAKLLPQTSREERSQAIRLLRVKYPQYSRKMLADDAPVIRITPQRIQARVDIYELN